MVSFDVISLAFPPVVSVTAVTCSILVVIVSPFSKRNRHGV